MLTIGTIVRAHGVRGWVRVRAGSSAIAEVERVFLDGRELVVVRVQPERGDFLVQLEGITSRDLAEALRGKRLEVPRDRLPPPNEDELYVADLIGCQVYDRSGRHLGEVIGSFPSGAHELLEVKGERGFLLPWVDSIVTEVDLPHRRIICDPPLGLVDLDEV